MTKNNEKKRDWSNERNSPVRDRELKLKFFYAWDAGVGPERIRCCHQFPFRNRKAMAKALGLGDAQLEGGKSDKDSLSPAALKVLGEYLGFDPAWDEFLTGTAWDFAMRYNAENTYQPKPATSAAQQTPPAERRINVPLTPRPGPQEIGDHRLAALKMTVEPSNNFEFWKVKLFLRCRAVDGYGIKRGLIDLDCSLAKAHEAECNFAHPGMVIDNTNLFICVGAGTEHRPFWYIEAVSGVMDGDYSEQEFCIVRELAVTDELIATFSVYVKDVPPTRDYVCQKDGSPLGDYKRAILSRIAKMGLPGGGAGQVVLCRHKVSFEDAYAGLEDIFAELAIEAAPDDSRQG